MMSLQRPFRVLLLLLLPLLLVLLRVAAESHSMPLDGASTDMDEMDELDEEMWPTEESATHDFQFQEQSVPQHSMIDAVIIWILRNPSEFAIGCACVLLPLFLLAMMSAYIMIRTMDQEKVARQEQQEEEQKQAAQAPPATAGVSGAQGKAARSKQRAASKESPVAGGAADGLTHRPTAAAAASS